MDEYLELIKRFFIARRFMLSASEKDKDAWFKEFKKTLTDVELKRMELGDQEVYKKYALMTREEVEELIK